MKYQQVNTRFRLPDGRIVTPFNAEDDAQHPNVSWSHGFTHMRDQKGNVTVCGKLWFEHNAVATDD